eukprot:Hpha_TRINITY_DN5240_c0_g1::TRINITY_DN5240_c0_g1_i1::g.116672::m.116672
MDDPTSSPAPSRGMDVSSTSAVSFSSGGSLHRSASHTARLAGRLQPRTPPGAGRGRTTGDGRRPLYNIPGSHTHSRSSSARSAPRGTSTEPAFVQRLTPGPRGGRPAIGPLEPVDYPDTPPKKSPPDHRLARISARSHAGTYYEGAASPPRGSRPGLPRSPASPRTVNRASAEASPIRGSRPALRPSTSPQAASRGSPPHKPRGGPPESPPGVNRRSSPAGAPPPAMSSNVGSPLTSNRASGVRPPGSPSGPLAGRGSDGGRHPSPVSPLASTAESGATLPASPTERSGALPTSPTSRGEGRAGRPPVVPSAPQKLQDLPPSPLKFTVDLSAPESGSPTLGDTDDEQGHSGWSAAAGDSGRIGAQGHPAVPPASDETLRTPQLPASQYSEPHHQPGVFRTPLPPFQPTPAAAPVSIPRHPAPRDPGPWHAEVWATNGSTPAPTLGGSAPTPGVLDGSPGLSTPPADSKHHNTGWSTSRGPDPAQTSPPSTLSPATLPPRRAARDPESRILAAALLEGRIDHADTAPTAPPSPGVPSVVLSPPASARLPRGAALSPSSPADSARRQLQYSGQVVSPPGSPPYSSRCCSPPEPPESPYGGLNTTGASGVMPPESSHRGVNSTGGSGVRLFDSTPPLFDSGRNEADSARQLALVAYFAAQSARNGLDVSAESLTHRRVFDATSAAEAAASEARRAAINAAAAAEAASSSVSLSPRVPTLRPPGSQLLGSWE